MSPIDALGIIGGGAWGTALALTASRAGLRTTLWARDPDVVAAIAERGENPRYLPGVQLRPPFAATADLAEAAAEPALLIAVPAQELRGVVELLSPHLRSGQPVIITAKGIDRASGKRLSELLVEAVPYVEPAALSGPSFAADVARGLPTAVTIAATSEVLALDLCRALGSPTFRPYAETDIVGVELGGALKNVLAIAAGVVAGRRLGSSAGAALVARGFAEMRRFAEASGARAETLMGLSGLGDLVLTCSSRQSRNFSFGIALGEGKPPPAGMLVEGVATAEIVADLAATRGIDMPVTTAVADVLAGRIDVAGAVEQLMARPLRHEADRRKD